MKTTKIFAIITMALLMIAMPSEAQSRKDKKAAKKAEWEARQQFVRDSTERANKAKLAAMDRENDKAAAKASATIGNEVEIPCIESSFDDEDYFRDLGIGTDTNNNKQAARNDAVEQAKSIIKARLGEYIQGVTTDYFNSYTTTSETDDVQHKLEAKLNGVVDYMLNNADKECEKLIKNDRGNWEFYYVIRIPKQDLKKQIIDAAKEEKTLIDFNEHRMQKFMDENMKKMLDEKSKAGY